MEDIRIERPGNPRVRGPLKDLQLNKYKTAETLRYPLDLSADDGQNRLTHYIKFNINIPEKSKYQTQKTVIPNKLSVADTNRSTGFQIGNTADPFTAGSITAGAGILAAIDVAATGLSGGASVTQLAFGAAATGAATSLLAFVDMQRKTKRLAQQIFLYIPDTVQQKISTEWKTVSLTEALGKAGFAAQAAQAMGGRTFSLENAWSDGTMNELGAGRSSPAAASGGVLAEAMGKAAEASGLYGADIEKVMLASAGYAKNPQIEVLFDTVRNREFMFQFMFSPKSQQEANTVLDIIKAFKFHAAPEMIDAVGGGRYFVPPSEFDIEYYFDGQPNKALHKFSTCVCTGIDINYSSGQFATYDDGVPIQIAMQLNFLEVEILHKKLVEDGY